LHLSEERWRCLWWRAPKRGQSFIGSFGSPLNPNPIHFSMVFAKDCARGDMLKEGTFRATLCAGRSPGLAQDRVRTEARRRRSCCVEWPSNARHDCCNGCSCPVCSERRSDRARSGQEPRATGHQFHGRHLPFARVGGEARRTAQRRLSRASPTCGAVKYGSSGRTIGMAGYSAGLQGIGHRTSLCSLLRRK
jgi:hypothetical protein